jgi:hypothetical protein
VPIGVELLGAAWSEPQLLALACSYEQATRPRRPPTTTPALVNGKAPSPVTGTIALGSGAGSASGRMAFRYDEPTGRMTYELSSAAGTTIVAAALRRGAQGPVVAVLRNPADPAATGDMRLSAAAQAALRAGDLFVEVVLDRGEMLRAPMTLAR